LKEFEVIMTQFTKAAIGEIKGFIAHPTDWFLSASAGISGNRAKSPKGGLAGKILALG
jgi:hypothetical protein